MIICVKFYVATVGSLFPPPFVVETDVLRDVVAGGDGSGPYISDEGAEG